MKSAKASWKRLFWIGLGAVLALAPTLTAFAGADYGD